MAESIEWLRAFITNHNSLEYVIIFFGSLLGAEFALFIFGFLAAQNVVSIVPLALFGFLGTLAPNILWFLLGKTKTVNRIALNRHADTTTSMITQAVNKISKDNHFIAFIIIKFIIGTAFLLIMYVNKTAMKFRQFLYYETPAVLLSLFIMAGIGYLSGLGFTYLSELFNNLYVALGFILLIALLVAIAKSWIKKRFVV